MNSITAFIIIGFVLASAWQCWRCADKALLGKPAKWAAAILGAVLFVFGQLFVDQALTSGSKTHRIPLLEGFPSIFTTVAIFCITFAIIYGLSHLLVNFSSAKKQRGCD